MISSKAKYVRQSRCFKSANVRSGLLGLAANSNFSPQRRRDAEKSGLLPGRSTPKPSEDRPQHLCASAVRTSGPGSAERSDFSPQRHGDAEKSGLLLERSTQKSSEDRPQRLCASAVKTSGPRSAATCGFDFRDVDFLHFHHRGKSALGFRAARGHRAGEGAGRDLPGQSPAILAPAAGAFLATIANDGIPVAIGLLLGVSGDLKGKGLAVCKLRSAIQAETGNAQDGKFHREHVARFA